MARNRAHIGVPPAAVWDVLSDPESYGEWVVGSRDIRDADPGWPEPGSAFYHSLGVGPFTIRDNTLSLGAQPPRRLLLQANSRPLGAARVEILLEPDGSGTRVTMVEDPAGRVAWLRFSPLVHALVRLRNAEALRRLKRLAEGAASPLP